MCLIDLPTIGAQMKKTNVNECFCLKLKRAWHLFKDHRGYSRTPFTCNTMVSRAITIDSKRIIAEIGSSSICIFIRRRFWTGSFC